MSRPYVWDLDQSGAGDGWIPVWDDAAGSWTVAAPSGGGGGATVLDDLTDVDTTSTPPTNLQGLLFHTGSSLWLPGDVPPVNSPAFSGNPTAPTPSPGDNDTSISTTAFVQAAIAAGLVSPAFSGNPTAPTPTAGDNDTSVATTAFVQTAVGGSVPKALFDANTILAATTDDTPAALTVPASTFLGRKASGNIAAMSVADALALLGVTGTRTNRDPKWTPLSSQTSYDEHNDSSQDAAWLRVDNTGHAGRVVWTEDGDVMSAYQGGSDSAAEYHALIRPLSGVGGSMVAGDAFITLVSLHIRVGSSLGLGGLVLSDGTAYGSGNQVLNIAYSTGAPIAVDLRGGTGFSADTGGGSSNFQSSQSFVWLRLVMTAANTWRSDTSLDGISWRTGTATLSKTITPTHVGYLSSSYGFAEQSVETYECIRRVAGVP